MFLSQVNGDTDESPWKALAVQNLVQLLGAAAHRPTAGKMLDDVSVFQRANCFVSSLARLAMRVGWL